MSDARQRCPMKKAALLYLEIINHVSGTGAPPPGAAPGLHPPPLIEFQDL